MIKNNNWWDNLDPTFKEYIKRQPYYFLKDLVKAGIVSAIFGFLIGIAVGFEWAFNYKLYMN